MTLIVSHVVAVTAQDYPYAFGASFVTDQQPGLGALSVYFDHAIDDEWRVDFREPTLEQVRGLGLPLLPFDF
jgi:hypothetical protein